MREPMRELKREGTHDAEVICTLGDAPIEPHAVVEQKHIASLARRLHEALLRSGASAHASAPYTA